MLIGKDKSAIDTPALWVDVDLMESNIQRLTDYLRDAGVAWRPHTKGIKVPAIAHKLLGAGAIGVTCAKLGEAEVMAEASIKDILVANQVVGPQKVARLVNLRRSADVMVAVDSLKNAQEISEAAVGTGVKIRVLVELNTGMDRAGLEPGEPALEFAKRIAHLPGIDVAGVMSWEGHALETEDLEERRELTLTAVRSLVQTAEMCREVGLEMPIVSCGGSGTYWITAHIPGVTEIQAGGAIFSDVAYRTWGARTTPSLFIHATVTSRASAICAVVDAGRKTMNGDTAMPEVRDVRGVRVSGLSAEHGGLELSGPEVPLKVGDRLDFIIGYGDNTVYLHDTLYGIRNGIVEAAWPILARGKLT